MLAIRSNYTYFRDFDDRAVPPPSLPLPAEISLRSWPSASSVSSAKINIESIYHTVATNAGYKNTHMSLVNSSIVINDLIAKYVG